MARSHSSSFQAREIPGPIDRDLLNLDNDDDDDDDQPSNLTSSKMSESTKPKLEKIADPEDDLDDLDDVLDEFAEKAPSAPPPTAATSEFTATSGRPRTNTRVDAKPASIPGAAPSLDPTAEVDEDELSSAFARELAKGMEDLMREISGGEPSAASSSSAGASGSGANPLGEDDETTKALKAAWEAMLVEGMNGKAGEELLPSLGEILGDKSTSGAAGGPSGESKVVEGFQERIRQAMDKLKESEDKAREASGQAPSGADGGPQTMEDLLKGLSDLGLQDGENESELAGFLESMMSQLMSKEILYEPLKELRDSFPGYLANPPKPLSDEDRSRYEKQHAIVTQIIDLFEKPTYNDSDPASNKAVIDLMSEMQSHGSPPTELMGDLPEGFDGNLPGLDPNNPECTIA
ncbi:peroxin19 Pex19p [Coprinopsis cinerea okayama7|uniref:Peroxin19 Pex19p n=1 Tax=Coprinopsis cinerea (strain Okayama-7 / 130 / ATCC MYA-4618 / FGSC 9003) TaxID=240176 RepID=A8NNX5_COPC7|nr:peroxin19 Pex19p [Coprinopsis cinerea okayama7\|eukprot:XP_001835217.1 peroxin19 Pex19p [Coprinopsis cinerea okayama7\